jgi:hypothetical protein
MNSYKTIPYIAFILLMITVFSSCKKDDETYPPIPDAVYIIAKLNTGPSPTASTSITNSATGKVSVSPASARVYVNTLKTFDVTIQYTLSGTAVEGVNYTAPAQKSITIPAGQYFANINIPVINNPLVGGNKTIIITLSSASNNTELGLGADKSYKTFTYTLTN